MAATRKIALDAFGGDHCPFVEVEAAVLAARDGQEVILVGDRARLMPQLALLGITRYDGEDGITVHHASEVITMEDTPSKVVRSKPDRNLRKIADETGGGYFELERTTELASTFTRVSQELRSQYLLGFAPDNLDGKVHKLEVRTKRPGLTVRARKSYLAAPDKS